MDSRLTSQLYFTRNHFHGLKSFMLILVRPPSLHFCLFKRLLCVLLTVPAPKELLNKT
jgi:hypothetical protein